MCPEDQIQRDNGPHLLAADRLDRLVGEYPLLEASGSLNAPGLLGTLLSDEMLANGCWRSGGLKTESTEEVLQPSLAE